MWSGLKLFRFPQTRTEFARERGADVDVGILVLLRHPLPFGETGGSKGAEATNAER
jgi:hypothetical protein